jgi:hypothetical protein
VAADASAIVSGVDCCREVLELVKGSPVLEGLGRALCFGDDEVAALDGDQVDLYGRSRPVREPNVELGNVELANVGVVRSLRRSSAMNDVLVCHAWSYGTALRGLPCLEAWDSIACGSFWGV